MILLIEINIRVGVSSVMGDRYVESDEKKKIWYVDAKKLYVWAISEQLPYDEIKFDENVELEEVLNNPDDSDIAYFIEVDLKYPDNMKDKQRIFLFVLKKSYSWKWI